MRRTAFTALLLAVAACTPQQPQAAPGSVEKLTDDLDRQLAADEAAALRTARKTEDARAAAAERRIAASERDRVRDGAN